jgi:haloalkane dehalogenase
MCADEEFDVDVLRTPDERFAELPAWPFPPRYVDVNDPDGGTLRLHYIDEGDAVARTVLLLHGEPTWAYLYRHVIPPLVAEGLRVVAPDLIGFGRSDKPASLDDHTYARQVGWLREALFDRLDLDGLVLFCQDWGGLIGLRLVAEHPERFAGVVASNTGLPTGDQQVSEAFTAWQQAARTMPDFPTGQIVNGGSSTALSDAEVAAYDAPFPDASYQAGPRARPTSRTARSRAPPTSCRRMRRPRSRTRSWRSSASSAHPARVSSSR